MTGFQEIIKKFYSDDINVDFNVVTSESELPLFRMPMRYAMGINVYNKMLDTGKVSNSLVGEYMEFLSSEIPPKDKYEVEKIVAARGNTNQTEFIAVRALPDGPIGKGFKVLGFLSSAGSLAASAVRLEYWRKFFSWEKKTVGGGDPVEMGPIMKYTLKDDV